MKADLPADDDRPLDFAGVLKTLCLLQGETVLVSAGDFRGHTRLTSVGTITPLALPHASGFRVGSETTLTLDAADFEAAQLKTFDGTDFFLLKVQLRGGLLLIGDPDLLATDYEEQPPNSGA
ncbi:hypothetical protein [Conexibacter woesei]|uniref:hypothetical protein n=1 Tax=Conexibacter woesei TaxID=191495 RepID=UPI00047DD418|nr:hypothetical protein [Conexibacter woesei]